MKKYFVPCSKMDSLIIKLPAPAGELDLKNLTKPGIFIFLLKENPETTHLRPEDFKKLLYLDTKGFPVYYSDPKNEIGMNEIRSQLNLRGKNVFMPVLVHNTEATNFSDLFETDCITLFPNHSLRILASPVQSTTFSRFDEIRFSQWPEDTSILDFFDFSFKERESGKEIAIRAIDHRTLKLDFSEKSGNFDYTMQWKGYECYETEFNKSWTFPEPAVFADTVRGFRNIDICIPIRIKDFLSVTGFSLPFSWDRDSLQWTGIHQTHPDLEEYIEISDPVQTGRRQTMEITMRPASDPIDLPDSTILFTWCGKALQGEGNTAVLHILSPDIQTRSYFSIYNINVHYTSGKGAIEVQKDREILFSLEQECIDKAGHHPVLLTVENDEAYPYKYSFHTNKAADSVFYSSPVLIKDVPPGTYEFTLRDSFGFEITRSVTIEARISPGFSVEIDETESTDPDCLNPDGGEISVVITPSGNYTLDIPDRPELEFGDDRLSGLPSGKYTIRAENDRGCTDTLSYVLVPPKEIRIRWETKDLVFCPDTESVPFSLEDLSEKPDPSLEYQINGGGILKPGNMIQLNSSETHRLFAWNEDGCTLDTTITIQKAPDEWKIFDTTSINIPSGESLLLSAQSENESGLIQWVFNQKTISQESEFSFVPEESETLYFLGELYQKCLYTDSLKIRVLNFDTDIDRNAFPNAFSPNGDGQNDRFSVAITHEMKEILSMEIFDRYGNFIFQEKYNDPEDSHGWDGKINNSEAETGIYTVVIRYVLLNGRNKKTAFDLLLLR